MKVTLIIAMEVENIPEGACPEKIRKKLEDGFGRILTDEGFDEVEYDGEVLTATVEVANPVEIPEELKAD